MQVGLHGERAPGDGRRRGRNIISAWLRGSVAQCDFAKRFERGKLSFTGDVLQVISVAGRQQKFAKLLKQLTVGA
jgi:hypothetical protein